MEKPKVDFIPKNLVSEIKGGTYPSKGKRVTGYLNEISANAFNDYVQKNPHFLSERVKAMGIEVLALETEQKIRSLTDENQKLQEQITQFSNNQQSDRYNNSEIETLRNNRSDLQKKLEGLEAEKNKLVLNLQESQNKNSILLLNKQNELNEVTQKLETESNEIFRLKNYLSKLEQEKDKGNTSLENTVKKLEAEKTSLVDTVVELQKKLDETKKNLTAMSSKNSHLESVAELQKEKNELDLKLKNFTEELQKASKEAELNTEKLKNVEFENEKLQKEVEKLKLIISENETELKNTRELFISNLNSKISLEDENNKVKTELNIPNKKIYDLDNYKQDLINKNKELNDKQNSYKGKIDFLLKRFFYVSIVLNVVLPLFYFRNSIGNGFLGLWELRHKLPSVSFKKPNISFPTFSNPFSNSQIGNWIALQYALLRNQFFGE